MLVPFGILVISSFQYASSNFTFPSKPSSESNNPSKPSSESNNHSIAGRSNGINFEGDINEQVIEGKNLFNFQSSGTDPNLGGDGSIRQGKNLFDWLDGITPEQDPYIKKLNDNCLGGNLYECFKWKALSNLESFFNYDQYGLNENTKVIKIYRESVVNPESSEFARQLPTTEEPEFNNFLQFVGRKVESFLKSRAIEVNLGEDITEYGRYEPRAIFDDISSEVDILEDKKDTIIKRKKLKKLIVPLLIVLKLFKLKLLLFLPLILGLAGFKKILGLLAIAIPGVIGYLKFCKPQNNYGTFGHSNYYSPPHGPFVKEAEIHHNNIPWNTPYNNDNNYAGSSSGNNIAYAQPPSGSGSIYGGQSSGNGLYRDTSSSSGGGNSGGISFKDNDAAHNLAYQSYVNK